jgi:hypothetical protein
MGLYNTVPYPILPRVSSLQSAALRRSRPCFEVLLGMPRLGFDWHTRQKPIGSEELAAAMAPC